MIETFFKTNNIFPDCILNSCICERAAFKHSIKDGKGVIEYSPPDPKAIAEIKNCFRNIELFIENYKKSI